MVKLVYETERLSMFEAENKYRNCNILMINPQKDKETLRGEVYARVRLDQHAKCVA